MELGYDWSAFQKIFQSRRLALSWRGETSGPIFLVTENGAIAAAFGEGEDFSEWLGAELPEFQAAFGHRTVIPFERSQIDEWLLEATAQPHFIEQTESMLDKAAGQIRKLPVGSGKDATSPEGVLAPPHFLLEALRGWWQRVLPSAFGIYLRLEGEASEDLLLVFRRGRLEHFQRGDLAGMTASEQSRNPQEIVKYLSERSMVPVLGVFVGAREWADWSQSSAPWREVARALRKDQLKLVPFRWDLASLIMARGWVGL